MNFGVALELLKQGKRVGRKGWSGKWINPQPLAGMFIFLQRGYPDGIDVNQNTVQASGGAVSGLTVIRPYISMRLPDESLIPYTATTQDILAEDWELV